jgi:hypothetical protein
LSSFNKFFSCSPSSIDLCNNFSLF